jgi:hypothetical protein
MKKGILIMVLVCFVFSGCASIVGKDVFPVSFQSNPDGANITVKDEHGMVLFSGKTPTMFTLSAGKSYFHAKSYIVSFSKSGYADQTVTLKSTISGWYFGNILFGGLIGMLIVDPITGKMWKLPDTPVFGNLAEKSEQISQNSQNPVLQIVEINQISKEMRNNLIELN